MVNFYDPLNRVKMYEVHDHFGFFLNFEFPKTALLAETTKEISFAFWLADITRFGIRLHAMVPQLRSYHFTC